MVSPAGQPLQLTILVVDDEEPLRHYMWRVMTDEGTGCWSRRMALKPVLFYPAGLVTQVYRVRYSENHFCRTS
jgi:hypothetical protein